MYDWFTKRQKISFVNGLFINQSKPQNHRVHFQEQLLSLLLFHETPPGLPSFVNGDFFLYQHLFLICCITNNPTKNWCASWTAEFLLQLTDDWFAKKADFLLQPVENPGLQKKKNPSKMKYGN